LTYIQVRKYLKECEMAEQSILCCQSGDIDECISSSLVVSKTKFEVDDIKNLIPSPGNVTLSCGLDSDETLPKATLDNFKSALALFAKKKHLYL
jgi:hypothetical protein